MNDIVRHTLCALVNTHGRDLCRDAARCEELLRLWCPDEERSVSVLVRTLKWGVAEELLSWPGGTVWEQASAELVRRLWTKQPITEEVARWAVETWGLALGKVTGEHLEAWHAARAASDERTLAEARPEVSRRPLMAVAWQIGFCLRGLLRICLLSIFSGLFLGLGAASILKANGLGFEGLLLVWAVASGFVAWGAILAEYLRPLRLWPVVFWLFLLLIYFSGSSGGSVLRG